MKQERQDAPTTNQTDIGSESEFNHLPSNKISTLISKKVFYVVTEVAMLFLMGII